MRLRLAFIFVLGTLITTHAAAKDRFSDPASYLQAEAKRILLEGDRIWGEADKMRSESTRLDREATVLREKASHLDAMWEAANRISPEKYKDISGRDRSQVRMRSDADREDRDAGLLVAEGKRLDEEAQRLWKLAQEVDPRAQKDLLDRIRACCRSIAIDLLRQEIIRIARSIGSEYSPSKP